MSETKGFNTTASRPDIHSRGRLIQTPPANLCSRVPPSYSTTGTTRQPSPREQRRYGLIQLSLWPPSLFNNTPALPRRFPNWHWNRLSPPSASTAPLSHQLQLLTGSYSVRGWTARRQLPSLLHPAQCARPPLLLVQSCYSRPELRLTHALIHRRATASCLQLLHPHTWQRRRRHRRRRRSCVGARRSRGRRCARARARARAQACCGTAPAGACAPAARCAAVWAAVGCVCGHVEHPESGQAAAQAGHVGGCDVLQGAQRQVAQTLRGERCGMGWWGGVQGRGQEVKRWWAGADPTVGRSPCTADKSPLLHGRLTPPTHTHTHAYRFHIHSYFFPLCSHIPTPHPPTHPPTHTHTHTRMHARTRTCSCATDSNSA